MSNSKQSSGVIAAGLALFSMFFGAGDLMWPIILGGWSGDQNFFAMLGLLITGVSLPLLGLISMVLFEGNYRAFFGRLGKYPGFVTLFIIQAILGPMGSVPRVITLSYATLKPYMPSQITLVTFSVIACFIILAFSIRRQRIIQLLGLVLTPILLVCLGFILVLGFLHHPDPQMIDWSAGKAFREGLNVGYNTLDLIASFIFAPLVLSHFRQEDSSPDPKVAKYNQFFKMLKASLLAAALLSAMYVGLSYVGSFYTPILPIDHAPEERLSAIALHLLGPYGAFIACLAVALACLTTAIPIASISAEYIRDDLLKSKGTILMPLICTLGLSAVIANLGFIGIANMLSPLLHMICPGLIVLSILNIINKLFEFKVAKIPVFSAFAISVVRYLA